MKGVVLGIVKRCHYCGKPATVFLTQISNGKLSDFALCKSCAKKHGIFDPRKLGLIGNMLPAEISGEVESFIRKMLESSFMEDAEQEAQNALPDMLTECPACHYTLEEFEENGLLGCPECYKTFASELQSYAVPQSDQAAPAVPPSGAELPDSPALELGRLEVMMHDAVRNENYEEAAILRDRIRSLSLSNNKKT